MGKKSMNSNSYTSQFISSKKHNNHRRMVQGVSLTEAERGTVLSLCGEGRTITSISAQVNQSLNVVRRVIQSGESSCGLRRRGPRRKVMLRIVRLMMSLQKAVLQIKRTLRALRANDDSQGVQQLLAADPNLT